MTNFNYDLAIAYRIYPKVSKQPLVFSDDKYKLAELCLRSFRKSLGKLRFKMWVLLDGCPPEYETLFLKYFKAEELEFIKLAGIGDAGTLGLQMKILSEQNISEMVYLAEDDYFYKGTEFAETINFLKANKDDVDFVCPYDHLDYYTTDLHDQAQYIKVFGDKHWRTANSACHTFLTTKTTLAKTKDTFNKYALGSPDSSNWMSLTKTKVFDPFSIYQFYLKKDEWLFYFVKQAWLHHWKEILFGKKWKLWIPIPSMATHLESLCIAPTIDWLSIIKQEIEEARIEEKQ